MTTTTPSLAVPITDLKLQYGVIKEEIDAAIAGVIDSTAFILGPPVASFETNYAEYCGTSHCVGVSNGTDALALSLKALDIGAGDEVITTPHTFGATNVTMYLIPAVIPATTSVCQSVSGSGDQYTQRRWRSAPEPRRHRRRAILFRITEFRPEPSGSGNMTKEHHHENFAACRRRRADFRAERIAGLRTGRRHDLLPE